MAVASSCVSQALVTRADLSGAILTSQEQLAPDDSYKSLTEKNCLEVFTSKGLVVGVDELHKDEEKHEV